VADTATELPFDAKNELVGIFNGSDISPQLMELTEGLSSLEQEYAASLEEGETEGAVEGKTTATPETVASALETEVGVVIEDPAAEGSAEETRLTRLLDSDTRNALAGELGKLGVSEDKLSSIRKGDMEPAQALKYIQGAMELETSGQIDKMELPDEMKKSIHEAVKNLASGKAFNELLKDSLIRDFSLKADGDFSKEKVQQLYERMVRDTGKVSQLLDQFGKGDSALAKGIDNLNQNVNFMNQLNETFTYMQIPIQMSGENAHGDLYVMTNKKKLMEKDGDITALLHLEMEALGTMDIHVTLKDSNSVKTHFMLEDDSTLDLIAENIHILNERLEERGYSMTSDVSVKEDDDKNKAITAMLGRAGSSHGDKLISRYSFDVKA
jgi:flagellar hook-length control protein FliK